MDPRISVNAVCYRNATLTEDLAAWRELGVRAVAPHVRKMKKHGWDESVELLRGSGLRFSAIVHAALFRLDDPSVWEKAQQDFRRTIDAAKRLGADAVYTTSGHRGKLEWDDAARAYCRAMRPVVDYARSQGLPLLVEPVVVLHADLSICHTLRVTIRLAATAGMGICIDLFHCWSDADLRESVAKAVPNCGLVQVSDYVMGDMSLPARAVPGDGDIPIERILGWIQEDGYKGLYDLELNGPRIEKEGTGAAIRRAAARVAAILDRRPAAQAGTGVRLGLP